jgi:hypothetical protein
LTSLVQKRFKFPEGSVERKRIQPVLNNKVATLPYSERLSDWPYASFSLRRKSPTTWALRCCSV